MRPTLILNPGDDEAFAAAAEAALDAGADRVEALEERLRTRYPRTTVHARELAGERSAIWYVYREGHWVPPRGQGPSATRGGLH